MNFYISKRLLIITSSFVATHSWDDAVDFLKNEHRHTFYIRVEMLVKHNDREKEFIKEKKKLEYHLKRKYEGKFLKNISCEMIAEEILDRFFYYTAVECWEDRENGARLEKEFTMGGD